jgi:hypothetical protein
MLLSKYKEPSILDAISTDDPRLKEYDIGSGERSNFKQYCAAIDAARSTIYIESQYIDVPEIVDFLLRALHRGVHVTLLMPAKPEIRLPVSPERRAFLDTRSELGRFEHFVLAGIAGIGVDGNRHPGYSKQSLCSLTIHGRLSARVICIAFRFLETAK